MRINEAGAVEAAVQMGRRFYLEGRPPWPWSEEDARASLRALAEGDSGFLAVTDGGFLAGHITANPFSREWLIASEIFWWAEDRSGLRLVKAFRKWARDKGASEIFWSCPTDARANKVFSRFGKHSENTYSEVLTCA